MTSDRDVPLLAGHKLRAPRHIEVSLHGSEWSGRGGSRPSSEDRAGDPDQQHNDRKDDRRAAASYQPEQPEYRNDNSRPERLLHRAPPVSRPLWHGGENPLRKHLGASSQSLPSRDVPIQDESRSPRSELVCILCPAREVEFDGENGRTLTLRRLLARDHEQIWQYQATLAWEDGAATVKVHGHGVGLASFVDDVANAWRGFDGAKEFSSLEGQLELSCPHDGLGTIGCRVTLRQPWPPVWRLETVLDFGAGAHVERLARQVHAFVMDSA